MSGECTHCNEHVMDCQCGKKLTRCGDRTGSGKFYAHGKFFDDISKFKEFLNAWPEIPCDLYDFKREMDTRVSEIEMNMQLRAGKLTNREAYQILRLATDWAIMRKDGEIPDGKGEC